MSTFVIIFENLPISAFSHLKCFKLFKKGFRKKKHFRLNSFEIAKIDLDLTVFAPYFEQYEI